LGGRGGRKRFDALNRGEKLRRLNFDPRNWIEINGPRPERLPTTPKFGRGKRKKTFRNWHPKARPSMEVSANNIRANNVRRWMGEGISRKPRRGDARSPNPIGS